MTYQLPNWYNQPILGLYILTILILFIIANLILLYIIKRRNKINNLQ